MRYRPRCTAEWMAVRAACARHATAEQTKSARPHARLLALHGRKAHWGTEAHRSRQQALPLSAGPRRTAGHWGARPYLPPTLNLPCSTAVHLRPLGHQAVPSTYPKPTLQHRNALPATGAPGRTFQARSPAAPSPAVMSARASRLIIVGAAAGSGSGSPRPASAARSATDAAGSARPSACS